MLGLRAAPKEDTAVSSAEIVYGGPLQLPGQLVDVTAAPPPPCPLQVLPLRERSYADAVSGRDSILEAAAWVYVRRGVAAGPLAPPYEGPYKVLRRWEKVVELQVGGRVERVSADRLKPHRGEEPTPAQPPRRGRPPGSGGAGSPDPGGPGLVGGLCGGVLAGE